MRWFSILIALACLGAGPTTKPRVDVTMEKGDGGSMMTPLSEQFAVNKGSTLRREWITIHSSKIPADIRGNVGIKTTYPGSRYESSTELQIEAKEPLVAVEIRIITFNVWGERMYTLYGNQIEDFHAGMNGPRTLQWAFDESDVGEYYASICYVSRVRTKAGQVIEADPAPVLAVARQLSAKFAPADLEKKEPGRR
jgi:hypothetical protein